IGSSPLNAKLLWVGTDDGLVWRTDDAGAHWSNVTPRQLGAWSKVGSISPSHFDQNAAFVSVDRHRLDDRKPYIYRTTDGGKTWQSIVAGIPDGDFVDVVREDPVKRGLLYAGTDFGIFVSFDNGDHWHSLQQNLPAVSVRDIDVKNDDLVIATHGRGFWIMDDVSALRQLAGYPANWATRLYKPACACRNSPARRCPRTSPLSRTRRGARTSITRWLRGPRSRSSFRSLMRTANWCGAIPAPTRRPNSISPRST